MTVDGSAPSAPHDELVSPPPDIILRAGGVADSGASVVAVPLAAGADGPVFDESAGHAAAALGVRLERLIETESPRGDAGSVLVVPLAGGAGPITRLLVVGVGAGTPADWRSAGAALARRSASVPRLALTGGPSSPEALRAFAEGVVLGSYRVAGLLDRTGHPGGRSGGTDHTNSHGASRSGGAVEAEDAEAAEDAAKADSGAELREVVVLTELAGQRSARAAVRAARAVGVGVYIARDLVNTPSLVKSPEWLADQAVRIATAAGLTATVLGPAELAEQGFGGLGAVGRGSPRPPRLVRIEYQGRAPEAGEELAPADADASARAGRFVAGHRVLVGKGITFDSGGLSLKPPVSMIGMKTDMAGAAAVLGAMAALPALGVPGRVTGLLCLAENMIGRSAMRPGDVITCWGGTTVEVLNTDAEGRLVLADGLAYAAGELGADVVVDLATLTGAISVALGRRTAGLFCSDDTLADALSAAAGAAGERVWRLPLTEDYRPALESQVADLANMGRAMDVGAGSITAALFLREFSGGLPWAHLDIAGTARSDSDDGEISRGGTGWGVRTLLSWLSGSPERQLAVAPDAADPVPVAG